VGVISTVLNRHFPQQSAAHNVSIIPQIALFFKRRNPVFCKNRGKTAVFFKHLTKKSRLKGGFFS